MTEVKEDSLIVLPNGVVDISIRFDEFELTSNVSVVLPPSSKILRNYITTPDRFTVVVSRKSNLKCLLDDKEVELHTNNLDEMKAECLKYDLNIEFY